MEPKALLNDLNSKMDKVIESLISTFQGIRTGRAHPMLVDKIRVDQYGTPTPIKGVASLSVPEPRVLQIQPWDKSMIAIIEKAIRVSDLGINPVNDGINIRLVMPELNEARRKEMAKLARTKAEDSKVAVRNQRRDANNVLKKLEKDKVLAEDELKKLEKQIQDKTDQFIQKIDDLANNKEKDIMQV